MELFFQSLPAWAILVLGIVWITFKEVAPRINRNKSIPPPPPPPPLSREATENEAIHAVHEMLRAEVTDRQQRDAATARFEQAFQKHMELDRKQLELIGDLSAGLVRQERVLVQLGDTLSSVRDSLAAISAAQRAQTVTLETLVRWQREDTGNFKLPPRDAT